MLRDHSIGRDRESKMAAGFYRRIGLHQPDLDSQFLGIGPVVHPHPAMR